MMNPPAVAERPPVTPALPPARSEPDSQADWEADAEPRSLDGLLVSEEDYWLHYYSESDRHYEWNNGRLEEKPVSDYATWLVYEWFLDLLRQFLRTCPIARGVALEMGFRMRLPQGVVIRKPDFGVVHNDNPQPLLPLDHSYHGVFDLCIEALSDRKRRDVQRDAVTKKAEYAAGGVREYFILHREPERQAFYTRSAAGLYVPIPAQDGIIRSRVLPGLQFRLEHLCSQPDPADLRHDPVYAGFLYPGWRAADERADAEAAARAQLEAQLREATEARARAEAELERLRSAAGGSD